MKILLRLSLLALTLLLTLPVMAAQFYRWVDKDGNISIQSYIPPEYVAGGYEIIDDAGNVLKTVAPQISEAEQRANEAAKLNDQMQRARDEELLKVYRSPADVDRALKTWLSRMDMEIRVKQNRIRIKENEYDRLQSKAADEERAGKDVDQDLLSQMKQVQAEIDQFNLEIRQVELRQDESRSSFMIDRERMVTLWEMIHKEKWVEPEAPQTDESDK